MTLAKFKALKKWEKSLSSHDLYRWPGNDCNGRRRNYKSSSIKAATLSTTELNGLPYLPLTEAPMHTIRGEKSW